MAFLTIEAIKTQVNEIAANIGVDMERRFAYGANPPENTCDYPFIEVNNGGYRYVVTERGNIVEDKQTQNIQELLYWIFEPITSSCVYCKDIMKNKPHQWEQRRFAWKKQLELLEKISPNFKARLKIEIADILKESPFTDGLPNNMDYEEWEYS
jgi:hypothetical protein